MGCCIRCRPRDWRWNRKIFMLVLSIFFLYVLINALNVFNVTNVLKWKPMKSYPYIKSTPFWMNMISKENTVNISTRYPSIDRRKISKDNSVYILKRYPYIDRRIIKRANYSNWDERRHVSKLVDHFKCHTSPIKLLVTVLSHSASSTRREVIRKTWGSNGSPQTHFRVFFFVASVDDARVMSNVKKESLTHGDIVMGEFHESFSHNSFKVEMMLEWAYKYCNFKYLLKTDDDNFINMPNLFKILNTYNTNTGGVYLGRLHTHAPPIRNHPIYGVNEVEYSGQYYPPFVSGGGMLLSHDVVRDLIPFFFDSPFKLEDVYTSMLAINANVTATHSSLFKHSNGDCSHDDTTAVSLHFAERYQKSLEDCTQELYYTMLNNNAHDPFVYSIYSQNRDIMDAARRNGSLFNKFHYHLDYRYFSNYNHTKLDKKIHAGKLLSKFRCNPRPVVVVVTLLSYAGNFKRRMMVRKTWGKTLFSYLNDDFRVFFVVAKVQDKKVMDRLAEESATNHDLIMGDFYESFYNNPWKLEMMFEWAWKYCDFKFLFKVDDDSFINMPNLFNFLKSYGDKPRGVYMGRAAEMLTIRQTPTSHSRYDFTYDEYTSTMIPPFVTGGAVLLSRDVVGGMIPHFVEPTIKLEDVYVAYLALNLRVDAQNSQLFKHSKGECEYNDAAISLHFWGRTIMNEVDCMEHNFKSMLNKNVFVNFYYKRSNT